MSTPVVRCDHTSLRAKRHFDPFCRFAALTGVNNTQTVERAFLCYCYIHFPGHSAFSLSLLKLFPMLAYDLLLLLCLSFY